MITAMQLAAALRAAANALDGGNENNAYGNQGERPAALDYAAAPAAVPAGITADHITALIQPHIGNEAIKTGLGVAMRTLGVNALPETPAHLFGPLYQAFQAVLAQHGVGGVGAAAAPSASII